MQDLEQNVRAYRTALERLEESEKLRRQSGLQTQWLNTPGGILSALNKRECQSRLLQAGIPVTGEGLQIQGKNGFSGGEESAFLDGRAEGEPDFFKASLGIRCGGSLRAQISS